MDITTEKVCSICGKYVDLIGAFLSAAEKNPICFDCSLNKLSAENPLLNYILTEQEKERENPSPDRMYWIALVDKVCSAPDDFLCLSPEELTYYAVSLFAGEIDNGGIHQFFTNSSGDIYFFVVKGLQELNANVTLTLLTEAKHVIFPNCDPPEDRILRATMIDWPDPDDDPSYQKKWAEIEQISKQLQEDPDNLAYLVHQYAVHYKLFPDSNQG
ncbi:MAG: DUF4375 domain-containing protein [Betaproteobacteria bacterium]